MAFGIKLVQGGVTLAAGTSVHPAPITIDARVLCFLSFTGTTTKYTWSITTPTGSHTVLSSASSPAPTFTSDIDNGAYSVTLVDDLENVYALDVVTPTIPATVTGSGVMASTATIATLRSDGALASSSAMYDVQGYSTLGDGGGGIFIYDSSDTTSADNGGTIIVAGSRRYKRQYTGALYATWFGASPSNADNKASFEACRSALPLQDGSHVGEMVIPAGVYPIQTTWTLSSGAGFNACNIRGEAFGTSVNGTTLLWTGANDATMIEVFGVTDTRFHSINLDLNNKAMIGFDVQSIVAGPGVSNCGWYDIWIFNVRDSAGSAGYRVGNGSGTQVDTLLWRGGSVSAFLAAKAHGGGRANVAGWLIRGGSNCKYMQWDTTGANTRNGIDWDTPSGANHMRNLVFITDEACLKLGDGQFVLDGCQAEACTGMFLKGINSGGGGGSVTLRNVSATVDCETDADLGINDVMVYYRPGTVIIENCGFSNFRSPGTSYPKLILNSAYGYGNANNIGIISRGSTYADAPGPYIPVFLENGTTNVMTTSQLQATPGNVRSHNDYIGTISTLTKALPIVGRPDDLLSLATGVLRSTSGAISSATSLVVDSNNNVDLAALGGLTTTATDGFPYIPSCAGAPTGVPTTKTNRCPVVYDRTNNKLYIYNGAWKQVALT